MILFAHSKFDALKSEILSLTEGIIENGNIRIIKYPDGEIQPIFQHSIRYDEIIYLACMDTSESIMETFLTLDAAKRTGYKKLTLVVPYLGYSRQDRIKGMDDRTSIGSNVISRFLQCVGIDDMITIDLHNPSIQSSYNIPFTNLNGSKVFIPYLKNKFGLGEELVIVAPDHGAVERCSKFALSFPKSDLSIINKIRNKNNEIITMELLGKVSNKHVVICDDICDTGGTLFNAAKLLKNNGALSVSAITTHGILSPSNNMFDYNIDSSILEELIITNTIIKDFNSNKIKTISIAPLLAKTIIHLHNKKSIRDINKNGED